MADPLCNACNLAERKGLRPCPVCVRVYHGLRFEFTIGNIKDEDRNFKIRYIRPEQDHCYDHRPEAEKVKSRERKEVFKQLVKQSQKITNAKRRAIYQEMKRK